MFAGINFLLAAFVFFYIPETKQVSLEESECNGQSPRLGNGGLTLTLFLVDTRFGGQNHVEKGGDILGVDDAHHADLDQVMGNVSNKQSGIRHSEVSA